MIVFLLGFAFIIICLNSYRFNTFVLLLASKYLGGRLAEVPNSPTDAVTVVSIILTPLLIHVKLYYQAT